MSENNGKNAESTLRNHIAVVLDESGSMMAIRHEIMEAFNEQVAVIRESATDQPTTISLVKFSTSVPDPVYWAEPVDVMRPLTAEDYAPHGLTAMLDAVGLTVDRLRALPDAEDEDTSFLVFVLSDGQENNSRRYSYGDIAERIQSLEKTGRWTFAYMGANQDLAHVSQDLGIPAANVMEFTSTSEGVKEGGYQAAESARSWVGKRRAGQKADRSFFRPEDDVAAPEAPDEPGAFWKGGTARWR